MNSKQFLTNEIQYDIIKVIEFENLYSLSIKRGDITILVSLKERIKKKNCIFLFFQPEFYQVCHTKADYDEHGPSICRHNPVFGTMS